MGVDVTNGGIESTKDYVATMPYTCGCWVMPTGSWGSHNLSIGLNGGSEYKRVWHDSSGSPSIDAQNFRLTTAGLTPLSGGKWHYELLRVISATNRRLSVLYPDGHIEHAQDTRSSGITLAMDAVVGWASSFDAFPGIVAEAFWVQADIQTDGAQAQNALIYQLAYRGPFAFSHLAPILDYRSFRMGRATNEDVMGEVYSSLSQAHVWSINGTVPPATIHPPLASDYVRPAQTKRLLMV
ncbi:MAG TPA: hypothetical protein VHC20_03265 [Candidatus Paceibacterota bacterium]|nr:hypothetical protein [Candidatus Paceibacterota bacterium]